MICVPYEFGWFIPRNSILAGKMRANARLAFSSLFVLWSTQAHKCTSFELCKKGMILCIHKYLNLNQEEDRACACAAVNFSRVQPHFDGFPFNYCPISFERQDEMQNSAKRPATFDPRNWSCLPVPNWVGPTNPAQQQNEIVNFELRSPFN
jgi:hypothetical protein